MEVSHSTLCKFPKFYKEIFIKLGKHFSSPATLPSTVACQSVWYKQHIQVGNKSIYLCNFSSRNLNFVGQIFDNDEKLKSWKCIKYQLHLKNNMQFQYLQIIHALPQHWKVTMKHFAKNLNNLYIQDHQLIKCTTASFLWMLSCTKFIEPTSILSFRKSCITCFKSKGCHFRLTDVLDNDYLLVNHLLPIFKYHVYNWRVNNTLSFQSLNCVISQIKYIEETISKNLNKKRKNLNKWKFIDHLF